MRSCFDAAAGGQESRVGAQRVEACAHPSFMAGGLPGRLGAASALVIALASPAASAREVAADVAAWRVVQRDSGPDLYYTRVPDPAMPFLRARYRPPMQTTVLGWQLPDDARATAHTLRWKWRAEALPAGGDECAAGKGDSAAVVYATWKRALRWYTLKYVWSSVGAKGATCDRKRNPFLAQDTVVLESGGPLDAWRAEEVDLRADFRRHFEDGRADADVPDFVGLGLMSDGDQTRSESAADYAAFVVEY
jgi:hypothetical protein